MQVSGPVVDVDVPRRGAPAASERGADGGDATAAARVMEVAQHVDSATVRCVMLAGSDGLARGMDGGGPRRIPSRCRWGRPPSAGCSTSWVSPSTSRARCRRAPPGGASTASRPPLPSRARPWRSWRPASRSLTCWSPTPRAARSASSAAPAWARPSSSRS